MQKRALTTYVDFGGKLDYVRIAAAGSAVYGGDSYISATLEIVLSYLVELELTVSLNAATKLKELKAELDEKYQDEDSSLEPDDAQRLIDCMLTMETIVYAEIQEKTAFFAGKKRYNSDSLFSDVGVVVGKRVFDLIPRNAQLDISEAGKCILLERPTAAAFHIMRAAECTLKQLYKSVVKRGRKEPAMWANMVDHLVKRKALSEGQKGTLDIFRRGFRNPTAHPDTFYSVDQAQDLLATTAQLLNQLTEHEKYDREAI